MDVFVFDCVYECRPPAKMNLGQVIPGSKQAWRSAEFEFSSSYVLSVECRHLKFQNPAQVRSLILKIEYGSHCGSADRKWQACLKVRQQLRSAAVSIVGLFKRQIQTCDLQNTNKYRTNTRLKVRQQQGNTTAVGPFQWGEEGRGLHCSDAPLVSVSNWTLVIQVRTPHTLSMIKITPKTLKNCLYLKACHYDTFLIKWTQGETLERSVKGAWLL